MQANELRIGNFINARGVKKVVDVLCDSVNTESDDGLPYDMIEPILITYGWYESFGLLKQGDWTFDGMTVSLWTIYGDSASVFRTVKYVHELQNLYFLITGKELQLNKKVEN